MSQLPPSATGWAREKRGTRTSVLQWRGPGEKDAPLPKPEGPGGSLWGFGPSVLDI